MPQTKSATSPRQRLPAAVRIDQILDAALRAFGAEGYAATRIDDIAALAGLSKGGVYAHFRSKEDIFEALLGRSLSPVPLEAPAGDVDTADELTQIEEVIERMYARLADPSTVLTLRLLFADGCRVPDRVGHWRAVTIAPYLARIETLVHRGMARGAFRRGVLARAPWLVIAPGVHAAMWQLVAADADPAFLAEQRDAHLAMLRELLLP